jgi:hypothetical protein
MGGIEHTKLDTRGILQAGHKQPKQRPNQLHVSPPENSGAWSDTIHHAVAAQ